MSSEATTGGLYTLDLESANTAKHITPMDKLGENTYDLAHRRLGHCSRKYLEFLAEEGNSTGLSFRKPTLTVGDRSCKACAAGRFKTSYSRQTESREATRGRRLHADISGLLPCSIRGYRYYLIVLDDASRFGFMRLLTSNTTAEVLPCLQEIKDIVETELGTKVAF